MIDLKKAFEQNKKYRLIEMKYETIPADEDEEYELNCCDDIQAEFIDDNIIEIVFTRRMSFSPEGIFKIEVKLGELLVVKDSVNIDLDELKKEIIDNEEGEISNLVSRASLMIAQVTSSCGKQPVITPPCFVPESE